MTGARPNPPPVLLLVLDGIRPDVLRAAVRDGDAPALAALVEKGEARWDATSVFPSITPAATAAIITGKPPAGSGIYGHAWYDADGDGMVVYGAMTETVITTGPLQVFHNNVWRMNRDDLVADTLFETLHGEGVESACVNFPMRRGPYTHHVRPRTVKGVANLGRLLGDTVDGPKEYYMGDLFFSRDLGLHGRKGSGGVHRSAGMNDEYTARVGEMLVSEHAEPFTLLYFFEGDSIAHHQGLAAQKRYLATLDGYLAGIYEAAGGADDLFDQYAVLAVSDHGHSPLRPNGRRVPLDEVLGERFEAGARARWGPGVRALAVPNGRAAIIHLADDLDKRKAAEELVARRGIDLAASFEDGWAVVRRAGSEVRFRPDETAAGPRDAAGRSWEVDGDAAALDARLADGTVRYGDYPDALERVWGCVRSPRAGALVLSAVPGYTFGEVNGGFHKASDHGSLHQSDSTVFSIGAGLPAARSITGVAPTVMAHFRAGARAEEAQEAGAHP